MVQLKDIRSNFWEDKTGRLVIWQSPNIWLSVWFISMIINWIMSNKILGYISLVSLTIWAILEIFKGVNYFRRLLGLVVLTSLVVSHLR